MSPRLLGLAKLDVDERENAMRRRVRFVNGECLKELISCFRKAILFVIHAAEAISSVGGVRIQFQSPQVLLAGLGILLLKEQAGAQVGVTTCIVRVAFNRLPINALGLRGIAALQRFRRPCRQF